MLFVLRARLLPAALFGLPDGDSIVIPIGADDKTTFASPVLDSRTGKIAGYGTLSEFRKPEHAIDFHASAAAGSIKVRDNFVTVTLGWLNQSPVTGTQVNNFLSGYGGAAAGGYMGVGGGVMASPGNGTATVVGVGAGVQLYSKSKAAGAVGGGYSWDMGRTGLKW